MPALYWSRFPSPWGSLRLLATDRGLCRLILPGEAGVDRWLARYMPGCVGVEGAPLLRQAAEQMDGYLAGRRQAFDLPLDLRGSPFQLAVWQALCTIPYGETWSYRRVAEAVGRPQATRAVGTAIGDNPVPIVVPCHRVIRSDGSLGGYGGGPPMKEALLRLEASGAGP